MIEQLVAILEQKFADLTATEIADILWLTLQQWQSQAVPIPETPLSHSSEDLSVDGDAVPPAPSLAPVPPSSEKPADVAPSTPLPAMAGLTTPRSPSQSRSQTASDDLGTLLAIPDASALRQPLELLRALRPLIRQVPSTEATALDVPTTVRAIAETDLWLLKLLPVLEPWLELAIVVDATASMVIWQHTILALRRALAQSGAFRDVRLWSLETLEGADLSPALASPEAKLCIRAGFGPGAALQPPCRPQELLDPRGRRLILVISDCIAPRWEAQPLREMLQVWAQHGPMALLQVLPEWLWSRTALGEVAKGQIYSLTAGQANQSLTFVRRDRWRRKTPEGVKVPVITLEPAVAERWSQMVAGKTTVSASGLLFSSVSSQGTGSRSPDAASPTPPQPDLTPQQRLEQFRNFSSPMARRLAGLLAACPEVNLPIVRIVQAAMLPESQQIHVAEVLLGGLFKPQTEITAHTPANQVQYVFHEGVQPLVQDTVPPDRAFMALSTWLNHRFGYSLSDFCAHVTAERIDQVKPFAGVMLDLLKRRGREFTEIINRIESNYQPQYTTFGDLAQSRATPQDYEIRSRFGSSGIAVLAIHGGNLQPGTTQIADAVAGDFHSFYSFVSLKPEIDQTLYISSAQFDEPTALEIVGHVQTVLSLHGCQGKTEFIRVGGLDRILGEFIKTELQLAGFTVAEDEAGGMDPTNICNRGTTGQGVQIEISQGLRQSLITSLSNTQDAPRFTQLVVSLQRSLQAIPVLSAYPTDEDELTTVTSYQTDEGEVTTVTSYQTDEDELTTVTSYQTDEEEVTTVTSYQTDEGEVTTVTSYQTDEGEVTTVTSEAATIMVLQSFEFEVATISLISDSGAQQTMQSQQTRQSQSLGTPQRIQIQRRLQQAWAFAEPLTPEVTLEMVEIPGGQFLMGAPEGEENASSTERPQHLVTVPDFYLGKYAVTQAQWRFVAGLPQVNRELKVDPSNFKGDNLPVERVSWHDAIEFCDRLSRHTQRLYRLPSEAEWEYACRSGTTTPFHCGETITTELANYDGNYTYGPGPKGKYQEKTTPGGSFPANGFGLYDMHGNVHEWCADPWHENYQGAPTDGSVWNLDGDCGRYVLRGGSWFNLPWYCRSADRYRYDAGYCDYVVGFRLACSLARTL